MEFWRVIDPAPVWNRPPAVLAVLLVMVTFDRRNTAPPLLKIAPPCAVALGVESELPLIVELRMVTVASAKATNAPPCAKPVVAFAELLAIVVPVIR